MAPLAKRIGASAKRSWAVIRALTSCLIFSDTFYVNPLPLLTSAGDSFSLLAMQLVLPPPPTHFLSFLLRGTATAHI